MQYKKHDRRIMRLWTSCSEYKLNNNVRRLRPTRTSAHVIVAEDWREIGSPFTNYCRALAAGQRTCSDAVKS
ncbi:hypothetical protein HYPGJ_20081 [Hyphomicrobium sp. GJ21]|nr:hypothetical protein HYPGJ_20081 [Hyphomicrobium sp. GJ21]